MGNTNGRQSGTSSPRKDSPASPLRPARTFDGGSLSPHGIYPGAPDYNPTHVLKLIRERRLAPFYKGLDDYDEDWTNYQLAYMVKEGKLPPTEYPPSPASATGNAQGGPLNSSAPSLVLSPSLEEQVGLLLPTTQRLRGQSFTDAKQPSHESTSSKDQRTRPRAQTLGSSSLIPTRGKPLEAVVYRNAVECPVCFLVLCFSFFLTLVLPTKYKSYPLLLETHLHRMFCRNEKSGTTLPLQRRRRSCTTNSSKLES
jgi:hypothetical protein